MNPWNIPAWLEAEVLERDKACVYCRVQFGLPNAENKFRPTWEHVINDVRIVTQENIARCCASCNSSKGAKLIAIWLESPFCKDRGISKETVAEVVKKALI